MENRKKSGLPKKLWLLVLCAVVSMVLAYVIGGLLRPLVAESCTYNAITLRDVLFSCWSSALPKTAVKALTVIILMWPMNGLIRTMMGHMTDKDLRKQMTTNDSNDSPAWLTGMGFFALAILVNGLPFTSPANYIVYLLWKLGYALLWTVLFSSYLLWFRAQVMSFAKLEELFQKSGTDVVAIFIGISFLAASLIV